ncbi:MAG: XdhC family protein [Elusimicrobia bacterium]|nr:XdhC family protein [Elusimicrobiota bacterium]
MTDLELLRRLDEIRAKGARACLATVVKTAGSTPRDAGAKMVVTVDGDILGTVGGGCGEGRVRSAAMRCMVATEAPELLEVDLTLTKEGDDSDVCGGTMWVLLEPS